APSGRRPLRYLPKRARVHDPLEKCTRARSSLRSERAAKEETVHLCMVCTCTLCTRARSADASDIAIGINPQFRPELAIDAAPRSWVFRPPVFALKFVLVVAFAGRSRAPQLGVQPCEDFGRLPLHRRQPVRWRRLFRRQVWKRLMLA